METKNTITINKNLLLLMIIFIIAIITGCVVFLRNGVSHKDLFELKQKCAQTAQEFAEEKAKAETGLTMPIVLWKVLTSDYNIKKRSCFGEFDISVSYSLTDVSKNFSEYRIYDLLSNRIISSLTFDTIPDEEWMKYFSEKSPIYRELRKEIFGSEKLEYEP